MTAAECLAARQLLGWGRVRLAAECGVSSEALRIYERTVNMPGYLKSVRKTRIGAIQAAFESAGIQFIEENGGGPFVRLRGGE